MIIITHEKVGPSQVKIHQRRYLEGNKLLESLDCYGQTWRNLCHTSDLLVIATYGRQEWALGGSLGMAFSKQQLQILNP